MVNKKIIVSCDDLRINMSILKKTVKTKIIAVIKGDGYGLGLVGFAGKLKECGVDFFAVSEVEEALKLREAGLTEEKILLLTPQYKEEIIKALIENNIVLTAGSYENAVEYSRIAEALEKVAEAHIKLDTGFGRFGFSDENKEEVIKALRLKNLNCPGIYSHFSCAFEKQFDITKKQLEKFNKMVSYIESFDFKFELKHIANSSAALRFPETRLDAVRLGSAILGRLPIPNTYGLKKLAWMETEVLSVRTLKADHNIGYGNTCQTKTITDIAIVPIGYKDGYMTEKSPDTFRLRDIIRMTVNALKMWRKKIYVEINGVNYKLLGRVGMYNIVVDVTGSDVKAGDTVKLNINPLLINSNIEKEYR
ncbi:MAG: alanine racemase [Ruminococcaceae bacterium]|nr:alanine racemase [Oscillospiraceae bacterium]